MTTVRPCLSLRPRHVQSRAQQWATRVIIGVAAVTALAGNVLAQDVTAIAASSQPLKAHLNLPLPTAGGNQVWTDHRNRAGWRVQRNALTGHWRLLDPKDIRRAWGSRGACEAALQAATQDSATISAPDHVIILLHGLMRTQRSMNSLEKHLQEQSSAQIISFSYASTRAGIAEHAQALRELVAGLPGQPRVDFVGHSMGNIVVRHAIGDWQRDSDEGQQVLSRLGRVVMLGPPNHGAAIARRLGELGLFETIVGQAGMELGPQWHDLEDRLAVPPCPFAIVAGELSAGTPRNPLIDGASDFVVRVEEAELDGATEFHRLPLLHSSMMDDHQVQWIVGRFLTGS